MIEALTGAFSGVVCALIAAAFGFGFSRGKRFDFWILIVGVFFGLIAVQLGATFFGWQEWVYVIGALALFEYGGKAVYDSGAAAVKQKMEVQVSVDKVSVLTSVLIVFCIVFVEWWFIAFFMWFYPMVGKTFMFIALNAEGEEVLRWFALDMPQTARDAISYYLIVATPLVGFIIASPFAFAISSFINKIRRRRVQ